MTLNGLGSHGRLGGYTTHMLSTSNKQVALADFVKRVRQELPANVLDVRLFGSEARGEAATESNIDVLVVVEPDTENAFDSRTASSTSRSTSISNAASMSRPVL